MNKQYADYLKRVWSFSLDVASAINKSETLVDQDEFFKLSLAIFERIAVPWRFYKGE